MEIRTATRDDLREIDRIYTEAIEDRATGDTEPLTPEARSAWFAAHPAAHYPVLVAPDGGDALLGWASLGAYRPGRGALRGTAELSYYVARGARRSGVGRALVGACLERAVQLGFRSLVAILLDDNEPSRRLLEAFEFERWGHLPDIAAFEGRRVGHLYYGRHIA